MAPCGLCSGLAADQLPMRTTIHSIVRRPQPGATAMHTIAATLSSNVTHPQPGCRPADTTFAALGGTTAVCLFMQALPCSGCRSCWSPCAGETLEACCRPSYGHGSSSCGKERRSEEDARR